MNKHYKKKINKKGTSRMERYHTTRKVKIRWITLIIGIIFLISIFISFKAIKGLVNWYIDANNNKKTTDIVKKKSKIKKIKDNANTEKTIDENNIDKSDPYWDYIKMDLIDVDFSKLKKDNNEIVGWIKVNGTNVNYPFVQTNDNDYYLSHSFTKDKNKAGWVFMDYRNNEIANDKNTILYAHGRLDNTMFGSLRKIIKKDWLNNKDNHVINLSTENSNSLWQVFSVYKIPTTSDYLYINFNDTNDFLEFSKMLINRSIYDFNTKIDAADKIITLSTCYNNTDKLVLHAKLIKIENKN